MSFQPRKCVWCGKIFIPKSPRQSSCGDKHYLPCPDCGVPVLIKDNSIANFMKNHPNGSRCEDCRRKAIGKSNKNRNEESKRKSREKFRNTCLQRYGVDHPHKDPTIKAKIDATIKEKYGVDNLSQCPEIQNRIRQNSERRFGVSHYSNDPEIRKHMKEGMIKKYGVEYALQSDNIKQRLIHTNRDKYGCDNPAQSEIVKKKMKKTCQDRYGVDYALQSDVVRESIRKTCRRKYGAYGSPRQTFIDKLNSDMNFRSKYEKFTEDPRKYILNTFGSSVKFGILYRYLELDLTTVLQYCDKYELWDIVTKQYSVMEQEVSDFIEKLDSSIEITHRDRNILNGKELDLYLPQYKLGIECNPTYTHNSSFPPYSEDTRVMTSSYHKNKTNDAEKAGIFLFHIFGYEWTNKQTIIKSMLMNLLKKDEKHIFARKCKIKEVNSYDAREFLNANHRQGFSQSSVRLGLYCNDRLVSLMTFGKVRNTIGRTASSDENDWELIRFCNLLNTSVVGAASKLFKYFTSHYEFNKIVSYSDRAHTKGNLYEILGFQKVSISEPGYVWVNIDTDQFYTRVSCQKQNLQKLFNDDSIDIKNLTEKQIMESRKFAQVFDSGVIRWEYTKR